ncbi:hypothetical protein [Actinokineospora sp.]|uniref:hypothetical protein n=1 Tax=Actinokineospora sp. TaxID=1872133 RepID=UPI003D6AA4DF
MLVSTAHFAEEKAPCGKLHDGMRHQENDDEGLSIDDLRYSCGCRRIRHVYHDGSIRMKVVRHDGKVLRDEHSSDHEA